MIFILLACTFSECPSLRIIDNINGYVNISDCVFDKMNTNQKGSVVFLQMNNNISLTIEKSVFRSCCGSIGAGAIFFNCINGNSVLYCVCSNNCSCISGDLYYSAAFAFICTSITGRNDVQYLSISKSLGIISAIDISKGNQMINGINSSFNYLTYYTGLGLQQSTDCRLTYSSVCSNSALYHVIICLYKYTNTVSTHVNFCNNSQGVKNSWGLITNFISSKTQVSQWVFNQNDILCNLFAQSDGSCTVNECYFDFKYICANIIITTPSSFSNSINLVLLMDEGCNINLNTKYFLFRTIHWTFSLLILNL